jgi:GDP-L-fucose synthase
MTNVVAGGYGLAGSSIVRSLEKSKKAVVPLGRRDVDFTNREETFSALKVIRPNTLYVAAAKVGGIKANNALPVDFLSLNLQIQTNILDAAYEAKVNRVVFLASSCIYPKFGQQPLKEEYLMTGPLEPTNSAYAMAKLAGIELVKSYRKQFGLDWISVIPSNLYGPGDNFNPKNGHVLASLIHRFSKAAQEGVNELQLLGDGSPKREFLYVDDFASAVILCADKYKSDSPINIGTNAETTIQELAEIISKLSGYKGKINWDGNEMNGTPRKLLDISKISLLGWTPRTKLEDGIRKTITWYSKLVGDVK